MATVLAPDLGAISNGSEPQVKSWIPKVFLLSLFIPEVCDFFFYGSPIARLARIGLIMVALVLSGKFSKLAQQRVFSTLCLGGLVFTAMIGFLVNHSIFPIYLIISFIWVILMAQQRFASRTFILQAIAAAQILSILSFIAILLRLPSPFPFAASDSSNYFVPLNNLLGLHGRQSGIMSHANQLAPVCAIAILGALTSKSKLWLIPIYAVTLLTTGSNTTYISTCVGIAFIYFGGGKFSRFFAKTSLRLTGFALLAVFLSLALGFQSLEISNTSLTGRGFIWNQALNLFHGHLWFGLGWQFERAAILQGTLPPFASSVHNTYLEWLTNFGVFGLLFIIPIFFIFLSNLWSTDARLRSLAAMILLFSFSESLINLGNFNLITYLFIFLTWREMSPSQAAPAIDSAPKSVEVT